MTTVGRVKPSRRREDAGSSLLAAPSASRWFVVLPCSSEHRLVACSSPLRAPHQGGDARRVHVLAGHRRRPIERALVRQRGDELPQLRSSAAGRQGSGGGSDSTVLALAGAVGDGGRGGTGPEQARTSAKMSHAAMNLDCIWDTVAKIHKLTGE